ncbi:MAG: VWA domain-containing protein [Vicinamibacterales bacterium]
MCAAVAGGQQPIFKSGAERVTVAVVARDRSGRPMTGLSSADFVLLDDGRPRRILDFSADASAVSVAFLLDTSGSMRISPKLQLSTEVGHLVLASMSEGLDEAGMFVFDKTVRIAHPFSTQFAPLLSAMAAVRPFGSTSLYDAIAETAQQLSTRPGRRALIVLTDGIDTSSQLAAPQVAGIASAIDMPVYVVALGRSTEDLDAERSAKGNDASGNLMDLARWSGGAFYAVATTSDGSVAARQIVADLRSQYLLAFEPNSSPGWHRIEVRARQSLTLQARSGYWTDRFAVQQ